MPFVQLSDDLLSPKFKCNTTDNWIYPQEIWADGTCVIDRCGMWTDHPMRVDNRSCIVMPIVRGLDDFVAKNRKKPKEVARVMIDLILDHFTLTDKFNWLHRNVSLGHLYVYEGSHELKGWDQDILQERFPFLVSSTPQPPRAFITIDEDLGMPLDLYNSSKQAVDFKFRSPSLKCINAKYGKYVNSRSSQPLLVAFNNKVSPFDDLEIFTWIFLCTSQAVSKPWGGNTASSEFREIESSCFISGMHDYLSVFTESPASAEKFVELKRNQFGSLAQDLLPLTAGWFATILEPKVRPDPEADFAIQKEYYAEYYRRFLQSAWDAFMSEKLQD